MLTCWRVGCVFTLRNAWLARVIWHLLNGFYMVKGGDGMNDEKKRARSKADFIRLAGIGPELAKFLTEFFETPGDFYLMPFERRREIENQMDAVLSSFEK